MSEASPLDCRVRAMNEVEELTRQLAVERERADYAWRNTRTIETARAEEMRKRDVAEAENSRLRTLMFAVARAPTFGGEMGTKLRVTIDLERELDEERLTAGDLVGLLCADMYWSKAALTTDDKEQLAKLVAFFDLGKNDEGFGRAEE